MILGYLGLFVAEASEHLEALGRDLVALEGAEPLATGERQVRMEFGYDGGGLGKGADVTLYVDGDKAGEGRLDATVPLIFSGDETTDLGTDGATPVSDDYGPKDCAFNGRVLWVQIDVDEDAEDPDHLIVYGGTGRAARSWEAFDAIVRIDTPQEAQYYANGGILQYVLRQLLATKPEAVHA